MSEYWKNTIKATKEAEVIPTSGHQKEAEDDENEALDTKATSQEEIQNLSEPHMGDGTRYEVLLITAIVAVAIVAVIVVGATVWVMRRKKMDKGNIWDFILY